MKQWFIYWSCKTCGHIVITRADGVKRPQCKFKDHGQLSMGISELMTVRTAIAYEPKVMK